MPKSILQTGAVTFTASSFVPLIDWAASAMGVKIPLDAQLQLAAGLITLGHAIVNRFFPQAATQQ